MRPVERPRIRYWKRAGRGERAKKMKEGLWKEKKRDWRLFARGCNRNCDRSEKRNI
jgi:hypothetical protein